MHHLMESRVISLIRLCGLFRLKLGYLNDFGHTEITDRIPTNVFIENRFTVQY